MSRGERMDINSVIIYVLTFTISFINFKLGENYLFAISNKKYIVETHYIDWIYIAKLQHGS